MKEHLTYETITLNNVNSTSPSARLKEDSVNIYDYADVNIRIK